MYPQLEGYFSLGEKITLNKKRYEKDTVICHAIYLMANGKTFRGSAIVPHQLVNQKDIDAGNIVKACDGVIAPKGSVKGYSFTNAKGITYEAERLVACVGYKYGTFSNLFDKC